MLCATPTPGRLARRHATLSHANHGRIHKHKQWLSISLPYFSVSGPDSRYFAGSGCGSRLFLNPGPIRIRSGPIRIRSQTKICIRKCKKNIGKRTCSGSSNMNFFIFEFLGDNFGCLDPDSGSGSADPFESESNPDPKHCHVSRRPSVFRNFGLVLTS
jgi:hypothetical protein